MRDFQTFFTEDEIRCVNASVLASKYKISAAYVLEILKNTNKRKTPMAKKVFTDAVEIIDAYKLKKEDDE